MYLKFTNNKCNSKTTTKRKQTNNKESMEIKKSAQWQRIKKMYKAKCHRHNQLNGDRVSDNGQQWRQLSKVRCSSRAETKRKKNQINKQLQPRTEKWCPAKWLKLISKNVSTSSTLSELWSLVTFCFSYCKQNTRRNQFLLLLYFLSDRGVAVTGTCASIEHRQSTKARRTTDMYEYDGASVRIAEPW